MDKMSDELADVAAYAVTRFVEIADKYGRDRNEVVRNAATVFFEMAFSGDYKTFDISEWKGNGQNEPV